MLCSRVYSVSQIQGGDPTATGSGGRSIWRKPFDDEIRLNLRHEGLLCIILSHG